MFWKARLATILFLFGAISLGGLSLAVETKPNIILMMADDMGMGDTSAFQDFTGNRDADQLHTPEMERLARMGVRFTDAHTPSSRCSPTRYGLLTGRYPWRNRLKHWVLFGAQGDPMIEADRPTIASMLTRSGISHGDGWQVARRSALSTLRRHTGRWLGRRRLESANAHDAGRSWIRLRPFHVAFAWYVGSKRGNEEEAKEQETVRADRKLV